jgi:hypothetical protein
MSSSSLLSAVGQSLFTTGQAPVATPATSTTGSTSSTATSSYQSEFLTLQQQDTAELLYASFLSPADSLANTDAVLGQAAQLLGTPGSQPASQSTSTQSASTQSTSSATTDPLASLPSISSILAASDSVAQQTLNSYANAPVGSSIVDYQA